MLPNRIILIFLLLFFHSVFAQTIIQKPINFNQERIRLTQEYRLKHYGIKDQSIIIIPKMIILHWTARDTLRESFSELYSPYLSSERSDILQASKLNTSSQYLVDRDGTIYQLMPDNWMARHVIGLNNIAIGIENVGGENNAANLTPEQVKANIYLIRYLKQKYPSIQYLIGHYEYTKFKNTPLWLEKDPNYVTKKIDPGTEFMQAVRSKVKDLHLSRKPLIIP